MSKLQRRKAVLITPGIEDLRSRMVALAKENGREDSRVLEASRRLDELVNEWYRLSA